MLTLPASRGARGVASTASPFTSDFQDPVKELVEPAKLGTRNVLEQANETPSVKRVVVTSSCAAIYGDNADLAELAEPLRERFGDSFPIPKRTLPKWLLWLVGPLVNKAMTRKAIRLNVGLPWRADNSKGVRELGLSYRPLDETVVEFKFMERRQLVKPWSDMTTSRVSGSMWPRV